jgi:hypothetical protein
MEGLGAGARSEDIVRLIVRLMPSGPTGCEPSGYPGRCRPAGPYEI